MTGRIRRVRQRDTEEVAKGCPFCGQVPDLNKHFMEPMWSLTHRCRVVGYIGFEWTMDKFALIRRWNTRHESDS